MQRQLEEIARQFGAETGTVHLVEDGVLVLKAHFGIPPPVVKLVATVPIGKGMAGLCAQRNEPVSSCNLQTDTTGDVRPGARATGVNGAIVVPIRDLKGQACGALGVAVNREHDYSGEEASRLIDAAKKLAP
jgi:putative methionine-R-sulfoxide reductase with GAF domain